jgi:hypothetical protein
VSTKTTLTALSILLGWTGVVCVGIGTDSWLAALGVFLMVYGNNLGRSIKP